MTVLGPQEHQQHLAEVRGTEALSRTEFGADTAGEVETNAGEVVIDDGNTRDAVVVVMSQPQANAEAGYGQERR